MLGRLNVKGQRRYEPAVLRRLVVIDVAQRAEMNRPRFRLTGSTR